MHVRKPERDADAARLLDGVLRALCELLQAEHASPPGQVALPTAVWSRPGLAPALDIPIPDTADFSQWAVRLARGETVWATRVDLLDPRSRAYWDATDCACNLLVTVTINGSCVGWVALDWAEHQPWRPLLGTVLTMAAEGAAAAIRRDREPAARQSERDRLAREVHDTIAQGFGAIHMLLAATARLDDARAVRNGIEQADALARQHQREAREAIRLLRGEAEPPADLRTLIEHGVAARPHRPGGGAEHAPPRQCFSVHALGHAAAGRFAAGHARRRARLRPGALHRGFRPAGHSRARRPDRCHPGHREPARWSDAPGSAPAPGYPRGRDLIGP